MREPQRISRIRAAFGKAEKRANRRQYKRMFPGCTKHSIKSHSQQKKHQLESIAEDSFIYAVNKNLYRIFDSGSVEALVKTPIGDASRYRGFCNSHDSCVFSPIENGKLDIESPEHNFLLFLRAVSYEYVNKRRMFDLQNDVLQHNGNLFSQQVREYYQAHITGMGYFLEKDAPYYLERLFQIHQTKDWSGIRHNSFTIDKNLGVSATTSFSPMRQKHSEWAAEHFTEKQPFVSLHIVPASAKTDVSFIWLREFDEYCREFPASQKDQLDLIQPLNTYIFCESEDVCIRPSLWEKLDREARYSIYRHMSNSESLPGADSISVVLEL
jgi:hypothetical protein